jgi:hypothetical protein
MALRDLTPWRSHALKEKLFEDNPFAAMHNEMDRLLANFFDEDRWPALTNGHRMVVRWDVAETDDAVKISADLPGLTEKDIDVTLADGVLTIKGERKTERRRKNIITASNGPMAPSSAPCRYRQTWTRARSPPNSRTACSNSPCRKSRKRRKKPRKFK